MSVVGSLSAYLGIDESTILRLAAIAPCSYKHYSVDKPAGGKRTIYQPSKQTKSLQYALIDLLLGKPPIHESAAAYISGRRSPLLKNAVLHARFQYSIRLDFKDFFPSIRPEDLLGRLRALPFPMCDKDEGIISSVLFVRLSDGSTGLAIGAPASPLICNIIMHPLDVEFAAFASKHAGVYSRYADDLAFSTNQKGACAEFCTFVESKLSSTTSPRLRLNRKKTLLMSRGTRRVITGLYVTPTGSTSIGRSNKRYIRKLLFDFCHGRLKQEDQNYLRG